MSEPQGPRYLGGHLVEGRDEVMAELAKEERAYWVGRLAKSAVGRHEQTLLRHENTVVALEAQLEAAIAALTWYLEDDRRSVEQGILESVESRPAAQFFREYRSGKDAQR